MNHTVCHFEIPADDPDKLLQFYVTLFGWTAGAMPMGPGDTYWLLQTGPEDESVGGGLCRRQSPDHVPVNYILVESVEEYAAKAESLGATVQMGKTEIPNIGWFALLKDPQGNPLGLFEAKTA